jgi:Na+/H+ antiporter NhaD/arsenite permease-like protein
VEEGDERAPVRTAILGAALLVIGVVAIAVGVLPGHDALALGERVWPILLFVVSITVVTELAAAAGLFTVIAGQLARWGLNRAWLLWLFVVLLAAASTIFLSLDTTAVLLTPVVIMLARHVGLPVMPFALTSVWLANSASLLLPVSNLTNLLAAGRLTSFSPLGFAALMAAPAIVAIVVPCVLLFLIYRRPLLARYELPVRTAVDDPVLLWASVVVVVALLPALVSGIPVWMPALGGAAILVVFFCVRRRTVLRFSLLPWQLVLFACGLFLVVGSASALGLGGVLSTVAGTGDGPLALLRLAGVGAASANIVDNLPAYLALESTAGSPLRIAALLVGVNTGPLITPWASLATLLWAGRLRSLEVAVSWRRFVLLGFLVAPLTVGLAVFALSLVR